MIAYKILVSLIVIVLTLLVVIIHPQMHKPMSVEQSDFKIFTQNEKFVENSFAVQDKSMPIKTVQSQSKSGQQSQINLQPQQNSTTTQTQTAYFNELIKTLHEPTVYNQNAVNPPVNETKNQQNQPVHTPQTPVQTQNPPQRTQTVDLSSTPLTEQEEIIAWNQWRSDLQNKVMMDSKIAAPVGTVFHFSCTVDKYGNISNINTWSDSQILTPLAKRIIKPVLSSYQNQPILKFPPRTKRSVVNISGGFTMAFSDRYSSPDDYSDYERIR